MVRREFLGVFAALLIAVPAAAQHRARVGSWSGFHRGFGGFATHRGFVSPGLIHHRVQSFRFGARHFGPGFYPPLAYPYAGAGIYFGGVHVSGFYGGYPGIVPLPVAVPASAPYALPQQPTIIIIQAPPAAPRPAAAAPVPAQEQAPRPEQAAPRTPTTLLVLKDHSMYAVADYWVEGDRLHYLFSYGAHKSVPLDQLDLEFTRKLNEERGVSFELKRKSY